MSLQERVYSVLVVSASKHFQTVMTELLPASGYEPICFAGGVNQAKRLLAVRTFDFIIINSPLTDATGVHFAIDCCRGQNTVVLLLAGADVHDEVHEKVVAYGVFTLPKPTSRATLHQALRWMSSAREQLRRLEQNTSSIEERMEEIRMINRAKWLLIRELQMSEPEAHRYLEKKAMDHCISKKEAAKHIIKRYA
ncbi:ANTAR domain-containing response regulator [Massilicoli timonensis]|uniref:ANTAR domain-containing response regulator n=1 Tax=Massilicoli timonensis TaxID=2015901 RepID=UPI000C82DFCC|nr:ANTAR domain-containing protein [Massilicoli timonensis]